MMLQNNAIGLIELSSISVGYLVTDAMLKTASVQLILSRTVCPGKFIALVWGNVAEVEASMQTAILKGEGYIVNDLVIPNLHHQIYPAMTATNIISERGALGVVETFDIVSTILAADAAVKAADVTLCELRIAMAIGGKAFFTLTGDVAAVEAAVEAALDSLAEKGLLVNSVVIPRPREELFQEFI